MFKKVVFFILLTQSAFGLELKTGSYHGIDINGNDCELSVSFEENKKNLIAQSIFIIDKRNYPSEPVHLVEARIKKGTILKSLEKLDTLKVSTQDLMPREAYYLRDSILFTGFSGDLDQSLQKEGQEIIISAFGNGELRFLSFKEQYSKWTWRGKKYFQHNRVCYFSADVATHEDIPYFKNKCIKQYQVESYYLFKSKQDAKTSL